jgi:hypothetical protein
MSKCTEKFENRQVDAKNTGKQMALRRVHADHIAKKMLRSPRLIMTDITAKKKL